MKNVLIALFVVLFVSCNDDDDMGTKDYKAENEAEIQAYIAQHGLEATRTDSGLYYVIHEEGDGEEINDDSEIAIRVTIQFTDGTVLEDTGDEALPFNLQTAIKGWKEGFKLFNVGGSGILLVPAHLAFGDREQNGIPRGSVLIFDFEIVDYDAENRAEIVKYIADNGLNAMESDSGLFYVVEEEGTGQRPADNSEVTVVYKGYFTNGSVFDESNINGAPILMDNVIDGWKEGLQYFKEGGKGKLLIPSSLGYGIYGKLNNSGVPIIKGGQVMIFDIEIKSVD